MPLPRVAIVGRPNVGKSSLLNMLAAAKVSIVDPTPGVTRDRVAAIVELESPDGVGPVKLAEIIDTGGFGVYTADGARYDDVGEDLARLSAPIERQIGEAVRSSDIVLFVVDAQVGVTALDQTIADMLRKQTFGGRAKGGARTPVMLVANKTDGENWETNALETMSLGFGEPLIVSALNNYKRRGFFERLYEALPDAAGADADGPGAGEEVVRLAIVGKRNAGKSTLVNSLAGEERVIVSEIAGTTRDAVDVRFEMDGRAFVAIDTAGFRKRKSLADEIEHWATHRALRSIRRADVTLLIVDATTPISQVDKQLSKEIQQQYKPCVIVVNKWDLAEGKRGRGGKVVTVEDYRTYIEKELRGLARSPIVFATATKGANIRQAALLALELHGQASQRVPTGKLNAVIRGVLEKRGPSSKLGTKAKILFVSQVATNPPTIVVVVNHAALFTPEYQRYILNRLAEETPFEEVPVRLIIRDRRRARLEDLLSGAHKLSRSGDAEPDADADDHTKPPAMPRVVRGLAEEVPAEEDDALIAEMLRRFEKDEA